MNIPTPSLSITQLVALLIHGFAYRSHVWEVIQVCSQVRQIHGAVIAEKLIAPQLL
jgi:hypothetical protein